jgi:hypothetical protein
LQVLELLQGAGELLLKVGLVSAKLLDLSLEVTYPSPQF